ncbi:MFS transporter [Bacteroidetes bacterium SCGC AAA795-G10]|nr:MFS transporter [Bacteroidetes bacterium SCGC AAA795-G10]
MNKNRYRINSFFRILLLVTAGEGVFILPFVLARIFRPTFLDVFQLDNLQLGTLYSTYGVVALISYLYGGTLADRFQPKILMGTALVMTSIGGFLMSTFPSFYLLQILYGFWGFSTTFLFWAAMIKATRNWGGEQSQGKAFGFLEGGRGIIAATIGAIGILIFAKLIPVDINLASFSQKKEAFRWVILFTSLMVMLVGVLSFIFMSEMENKEKSQNLIIESSFKNILKVARYPSVGLLIIIVLSAYCGYKATDILSLYASEIMLFDEVNAAKVGSYQMYLRPVVCILIGYIADKSTSSIWLKRGFIMLILGSMLFASGFIKAPLSVFFIFTVIITGIGTYGLRSLYFSAVKEGDIPYAFTGTAVGIISVIGYTPDIFMGPLMGVLLDNNPGLFGHQLVFLFLAGFSVVGFIASSKFNSIVLRTKFSNQ